MTISYKTAFPAGMTVTGKWNKAQYRIERLIGEGANGKVYLVSRGSTQYAMKMGFDAVDHQSEINVLTHLSTKPGSFQRYLVDADDFHWQGGDTSFYVMKYFKGQRLSAFLKQHGREWLGLVGLNLLRKLKELHTHGWIFGDLKMENILVSGYGEVELVDFGGVTAKGRSVKQFTEMYDRGYWGAGTRTADEAYDLFSFAVLFMQAGGAKDSLPKPHAHEARTPELLLAELSNDPELSWLSAFLRKALSQQFRSSQEAYAEWKRLVYDPEAGKSRSRSVKKTRGGWLKVGFFGSVLLFLGAVYVYWQQSP
ncbi:serine/threonine protein kinase [Paenibacillus sp. MBLB4367]|uniref:serine/threonine protein kinase n=1 Tax=Paenibacillus sp. MBLB4367 TaxID=3384767 RepID=UPI0039082933